MSYEQLLVAFLGSFRSSAGEVVAVELRLSDQLCRLGISGTLYFSVFVSNLQGGSCQRLRVLFVVTSCAHVAVEQFCVCQPTFVGAGRVLFWLASPLFWFGTHP